MITVHDILDYLFTLAPAALKEEWDNVGLVVGRKDRPVTKALIALDASMDVLHEAADLGCQMIVSHHPVIFRGLKQLNEDSVPGRAVLFAAENQIACANLHTNLDSVSGGVNDILAGRLGLSNIRLVSPRGTDQNGMPYGYLRAGEVEQTSVAAFSRFVKDRLACPGVRFADAGKPVCKVAVGGGACGDEMSAAIQAGCDTFVTADIKYHQFCDAVDSGINLIDAGHFETEVPVCTYLLGKLQEKFPTVKFLLSKNQKDPIEFI